MLRHIHPVAAGLTLVLLGYVGSLGLRSRSDRRRAPQHHARLAPVVYGLILATWVGGLLSTWLLRHDLEPAASPHFRIGVALVVVLSAAALTSRWMARPAIRSIHPWFGALAMLLAVAQLFFGLQITP